MRKAASNRRSSPTRASSQHPVFRALIEKAKQPSPQELINEAELDQRRPLTPQEITAADAELERLENHDQISVGHVASQMTDTTSDTQAVIRVPGVHGGEPVIRGTRASLRSIVIAHHRWADVERVARSFTIRPDDVRAALAYYANHKPEIDAIIHQRERAATD